MGLNETPSTKETPMDKIRYALGYAVGFLIGFYRGISK